MFQLKPVFDRWIFQGVDKGYGLLATYLWQIHFKMYELTEIIRQKDNKKYAELLNRLREESHAKNDTACLKTRMIKDIEKIKTCASHTTRIFTSNASVNAFNGYVFGNSKTDRAEVTTLDIIAGDIADALEDEEKIPADSTKTMGLYAVVFITVGAEYLWESNKQH